MAKKTFLEGVVANCNRLNVRSIPSTDGGIATILEVIDNLTPVMVMPIDGNDEWYKVRHNKIRGYCMSKFIALKRDEKPQEEETIDTIAVEKALLDVEAEETESINESE